MKRNILTTWLLSIPLALSACDEDSEPGEFGVDDDQLRSGDPSDMGPLPTCEATANYNGISGEVHFPSLNSCINTLPDLPLVVLLHGAGYSYTQYDFMLEHLASWGYIGVSIAVLADFPDAHETATAEAIDYLDGFLADWPKAGNIDPDRIALVGHSRGGGTVRHLADALAGEGDPWTVEAVVVMAGTNADELDVMPDTTEGLLVMHDGADGDVPVWKGVRLNDRSGTESSTGFSSPNRMYKAFKLFEGGYHSGFAGETPLWSPDQGTVARGYVLAFLRGHLQSNMTFYNEYIVGDAVPSAWPNRILSQYSDGQVRQVVDHFEDGLLSGNTIGGTVTVSHAEANVVDLDVDPVSTHSTHAIDFRAGDTGGSVTWTIPANRGNAQAYANLSFRIAVDEGPAVNGLTVSIRNNGVWSPALVVSDYGDIHTPVAVQPVLAPKDRVMSTISIPLDDFGAVDDVESIRFSISAATSGRWFLLDSLEFAGSGFEA
jgi:dienelactone hydrolase